MLSKFTKIKKRENVKLITQMVAAGIAVVAAMLVSMLLVYIAGGSGVDAFTSLIRGGFGDFPAILETLVKATPIILTALAAAIAFRGQLWNIGGEGQYFMGAIVSYWVYIFFQGLWTPLHIILIVLFGCLGGAFWGLLAGLLKRYFEVNEIISTVMLNYIAINILSLLLSGVWKDEISIYRQTPIIAENVRWPTILEGSRLHPGFFIAIIVALLAYFILQKTPHGFDIRAVGLNDIASMFKGIDVSQTWVKIMMISGAAAGLGAVSELFGVRYRLTMDLSTGYGFTGIIIAMLAGLNPLVVIPVGIFFAGLINGGIHMQIITNVPTALISAIQAIILIFLLISQVLSSYQISIISRYRGKEK